jgi:RNA polymerase sigma-70 factor, ECF subfamily
MGEVQRFPRRAGPRAARHTDVHGLFVAEYPALVRTLALIVRDRAAAEDLAQDAFVQLLRHWGKVSRYDSPGAWVRRVAIRMAVREEHRTKVRPIRERQAYAAAPVAEASYDAQADPALMAAVAQLSPKQRSVAVLFYLEDRPMDEVADLVGCSVATGWVHLHRARHRLAELLGEEVTDHVD